jgi:parvulin-like peptidyl-prolyl isomerase
VRPLLRTLVAAALALSLAACGTATMDGGAAAVVDGVTVSRDVLERAVFELEGEGTEVPADQRAAFVGDTQRRVLGFQIQAALIESVGRERGLEIGATELAAAREQIVTAVGSEEGLTQAIAQAQLTQELFDEVIVPQEAYIAAIRADLLGGQEFATRTVRHILVGSQQEADDVVAELAAGGDFATLAAERSTDPGSAANGGELPPSPPGTFVAEFDAAVWSAQIGEIVGPVQTDFGFHVLEVLSEETIDTDDLEPGQAENLVGALLEQVLVDAYGAAEITIAPGLGEWDPFTRSVIEPGRVGTGSTPSPEADTGLG